MMPPYLAFLLLLGLTLALPAQGQGVKEGRSDGGSLRKRLQQAGTWRSGGRETPAPADLTGTKLRRRRGRPRRGGLVPIQPCGPIIDHCRLTYQSQGASMHAVASCVCQDGEDVSEELSKLTDLTCPLTAFWNNKTYDVVNRTTLYISGCSIESGVFPSELLERLRQTRHFYIGMNSVPYARLSSVPGVRTVPIVEVAITDSVITGLHEGWFSKTKDLTFHSSNSDLGIIGNKAFSGYGPNAKADIGIDHCNITNIVENAFHLPKSGKLLLDTVRLMTISSHAFTGGSEIVIDHSVIMSVNRYAFNLHDISSLTLANSTYGELGYDVLYSQPPIDVRTGVTPDDVASPSVSILHNRFIRLRGPSFQWLCDADALEWTNNTVTDLLDPPLMLKDENCTKNRDWDAVLDINQISCLDCADFATYVDDQVCSLYNSSRCHSCEKQGDVCDRLVIPYISEKCQAGGDSLKAKCASARTVADAASFRVPSLAAIASAVCVLLLAAEKRRMG